MNSAATRAAEAADRILELQAERASYEESAKAHEQQAREDRLAMSRIKKEIEEWTVALRNVKVQQAVESAEAAARASQCSAETHEKKAADTLQEIERMRTELATLLDQAKNREVAIAEAEALAQAAKKPE